MAHKGVIRMSSPTFALLNKLTAKPGRRDEVVAILLESGRLFEKNEACQLYLVTVANDDPDAIWVVDLWSTREEHAEALKDPALRPYVEQAMQALEGRPEQIEVDPRGFVGTFAS